MDRLGASAQPFFFIINFKMDKVFILTESEIESGNVSFQLPGKSGGSQYAGEQPPQYFKTKAVNYQDYLKSFEKVQHELQQGNTYLLNLTFPTKIDTDATLEGIYHCSVAPYKLLVKDHFVVFSPEIFVRIKNGLVSSFPMKGTIDAQINNAEEIILADEKETAEHNTIVDLIRNDLGIEGDDVTVKRFRYLDHISTNRGELLQVSSEICAQLPENYCERLGRILFGMLPAGSVTGAPKKKTVEIINEVETYDRGFYTGIFGYFDGQDMDSAVMIRFIERLPDGTLVYKSGGGITAQSEAAKEYMELNDKVYVPFTGKH